MTATSWLQDRERRQKWLQFMQDFYPETNPQSIRLMDELGSVARAFYHVGEQSVEEAGLSFAQYKVLMHLYFAEKMGEHAEMNPSQISDRQRVSRNTMSALIRNLEEENMVERRLDADDRRRFNISLTERGRAVVHSHMHEHLELIDHCFGALDADEQATLMALLQKLGARVMVVRQEGR